MSSKAKNYTSLSAIASNASTSNLVDILLSTVWPTVITQFATSPPPAIGAAPMDVIVRSTKPRYHFVPGAGEPRSFWEREPYAWDEENGRVARFVGLGAFGGTPGQGKKQRVSTTCLPILPYRDCQAYAYIIVVLCVYNITSVRNVAPSPEGGECDSESVHCRHSRTKACA
jgi:hypothetical protein